MEETKKCMCSSSDVRVVACSGVIEKVKEELAP
jgi:hypothetical protein